MSGIKRTKADADFSLMIRERARWRCQRCGAVHVQGDRGLDCAHMYARRCAVCTAKRPRGVPAKEHVCTRLDPDNAIALCVGCHFEMDTHPDLKRDLWRSIIGDERFEALSAKAHGKRDR